MYALLAYSAKQPKVKLKTFTSQRHTHAQRQIFRHPILARPDTINCIKFTAICQRILFIVFGSLVLFEKRNIFVACAAKNENNKIEKKKKNKQISLLIISCYNSKRGTKRKIIEFFSLERNEKRRNTITLRHATQNNNKIELHSIKLKRKLFSD